MDKSIYKKQPVPSFAGAGHSVQRSVPGVVVLSVIFNNIYGYMGLAFACIGMIFAVVFTPMVDFSPLLYSGSETETVRGVITEVNHTGVSVNDDNVLEYKYRFEYMGRSYGGVSFSTDHMYAVNQNAPVEFEPSNPSISRIKGMDLKPLPVFILFVYIFPVTGFVFLYFAFRRGIPKIHAIRCGIMTRGRFVKMTGTGGSINNQTIYDLHFSFKDRMGNEFTAIGTTHKTEPVLDEAEERIIYDPDNPSNAVVVDAMPGTVRKFLASVPG